MPTEKQAEMNLPPGQTPIKHILRWGIDHPGITPSTPGIDLKTYVLIIDGEVENSVKLTWNEILKLPAVESVSDFHCVEGWSVLDCKWGGVIFKEILSLVKPKAMANSVSFKCVDGYSTSLTLDELSDNNVLLAYKLNGKMLEIGHGFPLRLIVPSKYAYKSAMWINHLEFTSKKELGFWEKRGYSDTAEVWKNDRFSK